jgi:phosphoserine phosphatase RsbU/P
MKLRRLAYIGASLLLLLLVLTIDVIRKNVELEIGGLSFLRDVMVIGAIILASVVLTSAAVFRGDSPVKKLGLILIAAIAMLVVSVTMSLASGGGFDSKNGFLIPLGYGSVFFATFVSITYGVFSVFVARLLRDLVFFRRRRGTRRNFLIFVGLVLGTSASTLMLKPLESSILTSIVFGLALFFAVVNSFRLQWIVYLTKREKVFGLVYSFFLFSVFVGLSIFVQGSSLSRGLLYYSYPLREFIVLVALSGAIYFGMAFVSTLFHLPTAEAFDRKTSEVSSLHNLSRLITQVFDFNELVETVTSMTLQVCDAKSCWLEMISAGEEGQPQLIPGTSAVARQSTTGYYHVHVAGMKNISRQQIDGLLSTEHRTLRDIVVEQRKPIVVDEVGRDTRLSPGGRSVMSGGSMVVAPLVSHAGLVGILYVTKDADFGFFKDDVDVISAFADQATIAIENSRLIAKSLERERLMREIMVAQEMQKKLLPQQLPQLTGLEIDAISTPAFEVGGDYYDFVQLDHAKLGIVVGDVSGKGVSAAFYMSEVKGIFQALSRLYTSPKQFMLKANEALLGSIDKHSFVSLIYAVIDAKTGVLQLARAGHCPMLLVSGDHVRYIRPNGMGMGLSGMALFGETIEEESIQLHQNDVCIFYTDGVTEARRGEDEFGYERLLETAQRVKRKAPAEIKEDILAEIKNFTDSQVSHDDLTLVVLKWSGQGQTTSTRVSS